MRQNTEAALLRKRFSHGLGALGSWATGGVVRGKSSEEANLEAAARQLGAHRESVIWFLRTRLQETARTQQRMMEIRLTREMEKSRSVLAKTKGPAMANGLREFANGSIAKSPTGVIPTTTLPVEEEEKKRPAVDNLTDDQKQLFEKGNQDMLKHLESTLDKVRQV